MGVVPARAVLVTGVDDLLPAVVGWIVPRIATSGVGSSAGAVGPDSRPKKSNTLSVTLRCSGAGVGRLRFVRSVYDSTVLAGVSVGTISTSSPWELTESVVPLATIQPTPPPTTRQTPRSMRWMR